MQIFEADKERVTSGQHLGDIEFLLVGQGEENLDTPNMHHMRTVKNIHPILNLCDIR